jgi:hypothetical protein
MIVSGGFMKAYFADESVGYGLYFSGLDFRFVGSDGEKLEGRPGKTYRKLPMFFTIAMSPILGGVFVMAFPVIVVLMTVYAVFQFFGKKLTKEIARNCHLAVHRWEPTVSYLNHKDQKPSD